MNIRIRKKTYDLLAEVMLSFRPPPDLSVSDWATAYRHIPPPAAEPGRWRNERMPHLVEIMNAMGDLRTPKVVGMLASQSGKSEACINVIGWHIHLNPTSMLMIQPTDGGGKNFSKERIAPAIRETPVLKERVSSPKTRDGNNTIELKHFPGGFLAVVGANAPAGLASRPIQIVIADEVDRYEASAGTEGDPMSLAEKRTTTYWNRKIIMVSTPGNEGTSKIASAYEESTMERWRLPCPKCGELQAPEWSGLIYKDLPQPVYKCSKCGRKSEEHEWKSQRGQWVAEHPERIIRGFHTTALISFFVTWEDLVRDWKNAQEQSAKGNNEPLKVFINTRLAEVWMEPGEQVEEDEIARRKEPYVYRSDSGAVLPCDVPDGVMILTAGVDIQENRAEIEVVGWGREWESWGIEYSIIYGDPDTSAFWKRIDEYLLKTWEYGDGASIGITTACVDSGHRASDVYKFTKPRESRRIYSSKGQGGEGVPMISRATQNTRNRALLFILGVNEIKGKILSGLKIHTAGPGYCHFPLSPDLDDEYKRGYTGEYFKGLVSERRIIKFRKGFRRYEWEKKSGIRNEPLDCRVYARAALGILNPNFDALEKLRDKRRRIPAGHDTARPVETKSAQANVRKRGRSSKGVSL
ncbi:MAG: phage terminase large subunit family protein [Synergistaceae bacterium]|jgi:phage terminase large subunit GpA-like protein|nr:phage terminase large subunit family protein [Synergistaceae bacterium]